MQPVELALSTPKRANATGTSRAGSPASLRFREPFDAVMGRALAHALPSASDSASDSEAAPKPRKPRAAASPVAPGTEACPAGVEAAVSVAPPPDTTPAPAPATARPTAPPATADTPPSATIADPTKAGETSPTAASGNLATAIASLSAAAGNGRETTPPTSGTPGNQVVLTQALEPVIESEIPVETGAPPELATAAAAATDPAGISAAQQSSGMKKADKTENSSERAEQKLPVTAATPGGEDSSAELARPVKIRFLLSGEALEAACGAASTPLHSATSPNPIEAASMLPGTASVESSASLRSVERTHELMSLQTVRLRESGADSLQVVIKPDAGTQLSLHLQMRGGTLELSATLNHGDYETLNRHWSDLQQQLEARGIRLAPLHHESPLADHPSHFQRPDRHAGEQPARSEKFADLALLDNLKSAPTIKNPVRHGWESWA